jgi:VWFA-related protein
MYACTNQGRYTVKTHASRAPARQRFQAIFAALAALLVALPAASQSVEREMFVSVLNQSDTPVLTLGVSDFIVREDGRVREVLRARRATDTIDIAILVDTSQALGNQVSDVRKGLDAFIGQMREHAHLAVVGLGDRPTIYADYTNSADLLAKAVGRVFPIAGSGAYTLDAITEALKGLETRKPERSAIVVVWAGGREFSNQSYMEILEALARHRTALHVVAIGGGVPPDSATTEGRSREIVFDRGTSQTGGRRDNILTSMAMTDALDRLAAELLGQYRITYARPDSLVPPEKIEVSVRPPGLTARGIPVPVRGAAK